MVKNTSVILGVFVILLLGFGVVSAYTSTQDGVNVKVVQDLPNPVAPGSSYSVIANVTNNNGTSINLTWEDTTESSGITVNLPANATLADGTSMNYTLTYIIPSAFNGTTDHPVDLGVFNGTTNIANFHPHSTANYTAPITTPVPGCTNHSADNYNPSATVDDGSCTYTPVYSFCEINGTVGNLKIKNVDFSNNGDGKDTNWYLLDNIEIDAEIENTNRTDSIRNVYAEIMILNSNGDDVTSDFDFDKERIDLNTINDDDSKDAIFKIQELPADLDSGNYKVYIKAYSKYDEDTQCVAESSDFSETTYQIIEVTREDDPAVIIKDIPFTVPASCGDKDVQLPLSIYNLGSDKEKSVLVTLQSSELKINKKIVINNIKSGGKKEVTFLFDIPEGLDKDSYTLDADVYYDYNNDDDELLATSYDQSAWNDLDKRYSTRLQILSCQGPAPTVSANLDSVAEVGSELVVKATIKNNDKNNTFVFSASDFDSWANLVSITPQTTSINKGDSKEVTIKLMPTKTGTQTFKINTIVDGKSYGQSVSVNIAKKPSVFSSITTTDMLLYSVIGIMILLVLIFLVIIVRISRRKAAPQF